MGRKGRNNIYCQHYLGAFQRGGKIWDFKEYLNEDAMEAAKQRIIEKYVAR